MTDLREYHGTCALTSDGCKPGRLTVVAGLPLCPEHIDRLRAIAADAGVPFNVEAPAA